ncbi:MAG: putative ABC transporter permease subunit [Acidobacteriota bacterium]
MHFNHLTWVRARCTINRFWPPSALKGGLGALFLLMGAAFLAGDFAFFRRIFGNLLSNEEIPRILLVAVASKLMSLVLLTTLTLLLFSAAVSALSYLYLDEDLALLLPLPVGRWSLRLHRSLEAGVNAGYMVALLLVPVVAAYLSLFPADPFALAAGFAGLLLYLAIPTSLGIGLTVLLARFFPARRLHQALTILLVVMVCLLVVLFRLARPENLLNPASSLQALTVLRSIRLPSEALLPSTWLADVVVRGAERQWDGVWPALLRLALTTLAAVGLLALLLGAFHWRGYGRAQEQAEMLPRRGRSRLGGGLLTLALAAAPAGRKSRALLRRDLLLFFRDPTQWGQVIILGALVVIYLFNVRFMPTDLEVFKVAVSFWNLATLGLIVASVAGRFAFTAVGSEGKAYFVSRVLPIDIWSYLWAKFLFTAIPLSALAALTLYGSNHFLGIRGEALGYTLFLAVAQSVTLAALALFMGTLDPVFDARNPAKAVMSAWGLTYMFVSLVYVGLVTVLSARPVFHYYQHLLGRGPAADYWPSALQVGAFSFAILVISFLTAGFRLQKLEGT